MEWKLSTGNRKQCRHFYPKKNYWKIFRNFSSIFIFQWKSTKRVEMEPKDSFFLQFSTKKIDPLSFFIIQTHFKKR